MEINALDKAMDSTPSAGIGTSGVDHNIRLCMKPTFPRPLEQQHEQLHFEPFFMCSMSVQRVSPARHCANVATLVKTLPCANICIVQNQLDQEVTKDEIFEFP
jgi:hypothetical protein